MTAEIETILRTAEREIVLVSPYVQISDSFRSRLIAADQRGIPISVLMRGSRPDDPKVNEIRWDLDRIRGLELRALRRLHAKCYMNESRLVIGSLNFFEASEKNPEAGVLLLAEEDPEAFRDAQAEVRSFLEQSFIVKERLESKCTDPGEVIGHCIRCDASIPHNLESPLCPLCEASWARHENWEYEERYCHTCGKQELTCKARPECQDCYYLDFNSGVSLDNSNSERDATATWPIEGPDEAIVDSIVAEVSRRLKPAELSSGARSLRAIVGDGATIELKIEMRQDGWRIIWRPWNGSKNERRDLFWAMHAHRDAIQKRLGREIAWGNQMFRLKVFCGRSGLSSFEQWDMEVASDLINDTVQIHERLNDAAKEFRTGDS